MHPLHRRLLVPSRPGFAPLLAISGGCLLLSLTKTAFAETSPVQFNSSFMRQAPDQEAEAGSVALQALATNMPLAPGRYQVALSVNQAYLGYREIEFQQGSHGQGLQACLNANLVREAGVREEALSSALDEQDPCLNLAALISDAQAQFDPRTLSLNLSIPQAVLRRDIAGAIDPARWSQGINAAFLNYQVSTQARTRNGSASQTSHDLHLNSGVNLGPWRLRSSQVLRDDQTGQRRWTQSNTYVQRDLPDNRSMLTLGETFSDGTVFRSLPFKGVQVNSDLGMLPDVMQNYAPLIRGVAQTRAKLEVLQNGYPLYSTYVAPGPYVIDDLSVGAGSGELEVVLTEADGKVSRFFQPYSSLANLLRDGIWRYSATAGRYNGAEHIDEPLLLQATLARGGAWNTTLYGGVQGGDYYRAATFGAARDLGELGALSFDVTQSHSDLGKQLGEVQGHSFAARYGKTFQSGTNVRFAGYRYSTQGYRDFDEAVRERYAYAGYLGNRRSRVDLSAHQPIGQRSSLSLTLSQDDYWRNNLRRRNYQFQFNTYLGKVSYNLFASQALSARGKDDRMLGLSISMPLDIIRNTNLSFDAQANGSRFSQRASLTGSALDNRLSYVTSANRSEQGQHSGAVSLAYQGDTSNYGLGYTEGSNYRSLSLNASGSLLLHEQGVVWGPYLGETNALVQVPQIANVGLQNATAGRTNADGFMVVPYLRPYRANQLVLDTDQAGPEVDIDNASLHVVPRRGAVVRADFAARKVARLILTLLQANGQPLPFGAQVSDAQGKPLAVVGQGGQALIATNIEQQQLHLQWGEQPENCQLDIDPGQMPQTQGYRMQTLSCLSTSDPARNPAA
ncbi:fimbria/pilus outer membrane usher protein [Pseudomonas hunanensis]|nr:fimbria/pilus outer membrane usher protein [Pseudomonas hunanensis]